MENEKSPRLILHYIAFVLYKRKLFISIVFLFTLLSFAFGTYLTTPLWKATAKVLVMQNPKQQMILFNDLAAPSVVAQRSPAVDLVQILKSRTFASDIVKQYGLDELKRQKALNPRKMRDKIKLFLVKTVRSPLILATKIGLVKGGTPNFFAAALEEFIRDMEDIELEQGTSTINLSIRAETPELATGIANTMTSMLIEKTKQFEQSEAAETYDFAAHHLQSVKKSLEVTEDELLAFKQREDVIALEAEKSLKLQRWDQLTAEFDANRKNLVAQEERLRELQNQLSSQPDKIVAAQVTGNSETYGNLKDSLNEAEMALTNLQQNFRQRHPDILGLQAQIELNRQKLQEEEQRILLNETVTLNPIFQELLSQIIETKTSISELRGKNTGLKTTLADLGQDLASIAEKETELTRLTRAVSGLEDRYTNLRSKLLELEVQKFTEVSEFDIKIADTAFIPDGSAPNWPVWWLNLLIGVMSGIFLGIGLAFFQEYWSDTLKTPEEVRDWTGLRVLGTVPSISASEVVEEIDGQPTQDTE